MAFNAPRQRLIIFGLIGFFLLFTVLSLFVDNTTGSSYKSNPRGARAFMLFLQQLNHRVETWLYPFNNLNLKDRGGVLLVIAPEQISYHDHLRQWIEQGNTLVYFGDMRLSFGDKLDASTGKLSKENGPESEDASREPLQGIGDVVNNYLDTDRKIDVNCDVLYPEVCNQVKTVSIGNDTIGRSDNRKVVIGSSDQGYVTHQILGKGAVWNFADSNMVINQNIDKYDNLRFLYQLVTSGSRILFDEFHHGYTAPVSLEMQGRRDSIYLLTGYIALALVFIVITQSFRFGPPIDSPLERVASSTEYASALGLLYSEYRAAGVLEHYLTGWKERIEKKYGISHRLDFSQIVDSLVEGKALDPGLALSLKESIRVIVSNSSSLSESEIIVGQLERILERT